MTDVVVLAGGAKPSALTEAQQVDNKAFIKIHGRFMLSYVLDALKQAEGIGRIAVVGPKARLEEEISGEKIILVEEGKNLVENMERGFVALKPQKHFLICSSDVPFLTAEAVEDLLQSCAGQKDFYYPIVSRKDNELRFPGVKRTYVKLKEGEFTGGNLFLVSPHCLKTMLPRLEEIYALRKSPLRLAAVFGIVFIIKFFTRQLSIAELEARFEDLFGLTGKAVISRYPEIGTDVDKISDLLLAERLLVLREPL
ncbi:MAG: NTP transferase domain-containing protein [Firmicutes bacterium]|nr:NTP transferase domain-containing protein [Bacillota bacterium]